jgi:uncharacterized membrane protein YfcA
MIAALVVVTPLAGWDAVPALDDPVAIAAGIGVGVASSVIPYVCDQMAMARLPRSTYALLVSLLPATATVIGIVVLSQLPSAQEVLGVALVVGGLGLLAKSFVRHTERRDAPFVLEKRHRWAALTIGFVGGLIVGLTSVGTGVFFGLTMLVLFPLRTALVVGTDIFHAAALLWVAGLGHVVAGNVDLGAVGWLLLGSIPGVLVGSQFTVRLPDRSLRLALATVLALSGVKLLEPPGENAILLGVLAAGAALLVVTGLRRLNGRASLVSRRPTDAAEAGTRRTASRSVDTRA